jgi:outer membrane protein OmpA-like peptidoglycan-associated protein
MNTLEKLDRPFGHRRSIMVVLATMISVPGGGLGWFLVGPALSGVTRPADDAFVSLPNDAAEASTTSPTNRSTSPFMLQTEPGAPPATATTAAPVTTGVARVAAPLSDTEPATVVQPSSDQPITATMTFRDDQITLTGAVPSANAEFRLFAFALGFALSPANVVNNLTIDPGVSVSGGVRIVEYNASHFSESSAAIQPVQAQQLDRIVWVMTEMPSATVRVIGNSDQRGDASVNQLIAQQRAQSVVDYLARRGIEPSRLAAASAGESDPLSSDDSAEAYALNRRTDFVIYGLLVA